MKEELKPCPFCASEASPHSNGGVADFSVTCNKCGANIKIYGFVTKTDVIKKWNTRTNTEQSIPNEPWAVIVPGSLEWQICPKCGGQGVMSKPPWIAGDVNEWSSTSCTHICDVCNGSKIIQRPEDSMVAHEKP